MVKDVARNDGFQVCRVFLIVVIGLLAGCQSVVRTVEQWYPNYSLYRISNPKNIVVYVHGYGGSDETFDVVPYLEGKDENGATIMFFNYVTGAGKNNLESISVTAERFRVFLRDNVFNRIPKSGRPSAEPGVTVVCHSTGCPVTLYYIANNPFDHRIGNLVTVAGAHYGAYWAEPLGEIKRSLSRRGDKQIFELKYGSITLFNLQARLHHLFAKRKLDPPFEEALEGTAFASFMHVVRPDVDKRFAGAGMSKVEWPRIFAVIGTDDWRSAGVRQFSDGVIRVESALLDCRFLYEAPPALRELHQPLKNLDPWSASCADRFVLFLPCYHTEFFTDQRCRQTVRSLIRFVVSDSCVDRANLEQEYTFSLAGRDTTAFPEYLSKMRMAALWVKIRHPRLKESESFIVGEGCGDPAPGKICMNVFAAGHETCTGRPKRIGHSTAMWPESDFTEAIRTMEFSPEQIYYHKYLEARQDLCLRFTENGEPLPVHYVPTKGKGDFLQFRLPAAQSTMVSCELVDGGEAKRSVDCEFASGIPVDQIRAVSERRPSVATGARTD